MSRPVLLRYRDPLDAIWIVTAARLGLTVQRTPDSYASTNGLGLLTISDSAFMDADDCLAQMILHELCHSLVQGPQSFGWVDWGLDNETDKDIERERACLRVQAALLEPWGLRQVLAPTTDFRNYYDELPEDPFQEVDPSERISIVLAKAAYCRRRQHPWKGQLERALEASAQIFEATYGYLSEAPYENDLSSHKVPRVPVHPSGLEGKRTKVALTCKDCMWSSPVDEHEAKLSCRQAEGRIVSADLEICARFEAPFGCLSCGACCREAYDTVEVAPEDPVLKLHLPLLVERLGGYDMGRRGSRCICLQGGNDLEAPQPAIFGGSAASDEGQRVAPLALPGSEPFTCAIYETRPTTCREFTLGSEHCLSARRTVGLSR